MSSVQCTGCGLVELVLGGESAGTGGRSASGRGCEAARVSRMEVRRQLLERQVSAGA